MSISRRSLFAGAAAGVAALPFVSWIPKSAAMPVEKLTLLNHSTMNSDNLIFLKAPRVAVVPQGASTVVAWSRIEDPDVIGYVVHCRSVLEGRQVPVVGPALVAAQVDMETTVVRVAVGPGQWLFNVTPVLSDGAKSRKWAMGGHTYTHSDLHELAMRFGAQPSAGARHGSEKGVRDAYNVV